MAGQPAHGDMDLRQSRQERHDGRKGWNQGQAQPYQPLYQLANEQEPFQMHTAQPHQSANANDNTYGGTDHQGNGHHGQQQHQSSVISSHVPSQGVYEPLQWQDQHGQPIQPASVYAMQHQSFPAKQAPDSSLFLPQGELTYLGPVTAYDPGNISSSSDIEKSYGEVCSAGPRDGWPAWRWPGLQLCFALGAMTLGYDVSNVANVQASIFHDFGHVELLTWVAIAYTAVNVCVAPLCRRLSMFGEMRIQFYIYTVVFLAGAAISGAAHNMDTIVAGRAITGIGGAGLYQGILLYNFVFSTAAEAPKGQAIVGASFAVGLLLGPIVGGSFAENMNTTWRWAFYINCPVFALLLLGWIVFLPSLVMADRSKNKTFGWRDVDWVGWVLHSAFILMLCTSLIFSGSRWHWNSVSAILSWVFTGLILVAYVAQQGLCILTTPEYRIFPVQAFQDFRLVATVGLSTIMGAAGYGICLYYTPLFFAFTKNSNPIQAAVDLLPYIGTFVATLVISSLLLPRVGLYAPFYVLAGALILTGSALQSQVAVDDSKSLVMGKLAIVGAGVGLVFQTGASVFKASAAGDRAREADFITIFMVSQLGGVAVLTSVAGCIFQNLGYQFVLEALLTAENGKVLVARLTEEDVRQALAGLGSRVLSGGNRATALRVVEAVTSVIGRMYYIVVAAGAIIFLCGCAMRWEKLDFKPRLDEELNDDKNSQ